MGRTLGRAGWQPLEANKGVEGSGRKTGPSIPTSWNSDGKGLRTVKGVRVYRWMPACSVHIKGEGPWNTMKSPGYGSGKSWHCVSQRRHFARR